jgi:cysteinyl-tRNA synthetase
MSKSLGNVVLVRDLLAEAPGEVVRLALLSAHYRQPLDWSADVLVEARRKLDRLYNTLRNFSDLLDDIENVVPADDFVAALEDDINTPRALAALFDLAREINRLGDTPEALALARQLRASAEIIGLLGNDPVAWFEQGGTDGEMGAAELDALLVKRTEARVARDFAEADRIRDQLTEMGIVIEDGPDGPRWRRLGS